MNEERKEFLEARRSGIGGSDVAAILGLSKWRTPLDVYNSKVLEVPENDEMSDAMHFGIVLEDVVAQEFSRRTGKKVQRRNKVYKHKDYPELLANIDRYVIAERAGLECKTSSAWMADQWGESGTDQVPIPYLLQCTHYMSVTGMKKWWVSALIGGNDFRWYPIPYNEDMANHVIEKCREFWNDHVLKKVPPAPTNLEDVAKLYETQKEIVTVAANEMVMQAIQELKDVKATAKELKDKEAEFKLIVQEHMKEGNTLLDANGDIVATWKASESNRLDSKSLKKDHPELYKEYTTLQTTRRFLTK